MSAEPIDRRPIPRRPRYRLRRNLSEAGALGPGLMILIWALAPV